MSGRKLEDLPHISLAALRKLIRELPAEDLAKLPVDKLPESIPEEVVDEAPFYSRGAVESLIMEANAYHLSLRMRLQRMVGDEIIAAIGAVGVEQDPTIGTLARDSVEPRG
ncbi:MAG: hypothetical protein P8Y78_08900 [Acidihalobacter sp.]